MKTIPGLLIALILLTFSVAASATDIRVRVFDRSDNTPLVNAAVCLGTSARIDQFGARVTDNEGYVSFPNVPGAPVVITVSRQGYKAEQETLVVSAANRLLMMSLSTGGGGTSCPLADDRATVYGSSVVVSRFTLNNGKVVTTDRTVILNNKVNGEPTQYRASERPDFEGADWQDYAAAPGFRLSADPGRKVIYFQVRRHASAGSANIETLSPVVRDTITLQ